MAENEIPISDTIKSLVETPRFVQTDGGSVTQISVGEAIAADKHLAKKETASKKTSFMGLRVGILRGPGHF